MTPVLPNGITVRAPGMADLQPVAGLINACSLAEGYRPIRHFWRLEIALGKAPPPPEWPAGITVRAFVRGQDERATHAAIEEAFADHWEHTPIALDEWVQRLTRREDFDPSLWFLAIDGDQIAGTALCYPRGAALGWVRGLGVRREWRGRGLGLALLHQAFGVFYERGRATVGLGVDAQSLTGATRLYERAGMRVTEQYEMHEKILEPA